MTANDDPTALRSRLAVAEAELAALRERLALIEQAAAQPPQFPAAAFAQTQPPAISIILPTYNRAAFIGEAIASIRAQSCGDWELIVVDDGSTDGTAAVLEGLKQRFPRLRVVVFERNGGYGKALSAAIDATSGQYVATIDSDGQFDLSEAMVARNQRVAISLPCGVASHSGRAPATR